MPNRIIKESICQSDSIDSLTWFEEVLFYRLIVVCDDFGRFDGRIQIIKGSCFPLKDVTLRQIATALDKLMTVGLVQGYEVQGRPYLQLSTWERHQQIRAKRSKYPACDDTCNQMISFDIKCSRNPIQSESNTKNTMCKADACALFERLWKLYPNKKGKGKVSDSKKLELLKVGFDEMERAIQRYLTELDKDDWRKEQNGSTFFNSGYIDYLDANYVPGKRTGKQNQFTNFQQREYDDQELENMFIREVAMTSQKGGVE